MVDEFKIRDFIYLDTERVKSIFSQLEKGLLESLVQESGHDKHVGGKAGSAIPFLKAEAIADYVWKNRESETRTLHDYMYNHMENEMKEKKYVTVIDENTDIKDIWEDGRLNEVFSDTSFVLINSRIMLDDYGRFERIMKDFSKIDKAMNSLNRNNPAAQNQNKRVLAKKDKQTKEDANNIRTFLNAFFGDRLVVKSLPFPDKTHLRFVGTLNKDNLRDNIDSVIFKYGTAPASKWWVFGQISSMLLDYQGNVIEENKINVHDIRYLIGLNDFSLEIGFEEFFHILRNLDEALSIKFPYVAFTPIAIYRG